MNTFDKIFTYIITGIGIIALSVIGIQLSNMTWTSWHVIVFILVILGFLGPTFYWEFIEKDSILEREI